MPFCFLLQSQVSINAPTNNSEIIEKPIVAKSVADQQILDDLIVVGSLCVGQDCVNGESFGFDTQRLKENNLRIHFDDTSTSASFPSNDWRIRINDTSNGGASYFAIEDVTGGRTPFTISAGAPNNSLFVSSSGRLGLGTSNPVVELHMADGDTPTMRLEQDGSSGFQAQTWDMAGNETNFFIRDVTNGSTLPFRIRPGAATSSLDIAGSGKVGFGTSSPQTRIHAKSTTDLALRLENSSGTPNTWDIGNDGTKFYISDVTGVKEPFKIDNDSPTGSIEISPTGVNIKNVGLIDPTSPSDERLKRNMIAISDATSLLKQLVPKTFYFNEKSVNKYGMPAGKQYGLIAQEVETVIPELLRNISFGDDKTKYKSVRYESFISILIQGFKEQQEKIEKQSDEIKELKTQLAKYSDLEMRMTAMENSQKSSATIKTSK